MTHTKIDWATMTWSPVSGCLHGCEYCYAAKQVKRFEGYDAPYGTSFTADGIDAGWIYTLDKPLYKRDNKNKIRQAPYPFGFAPTMHRYRMDEPSRVKKPQNIFVGSMCDLFGEWVPDEWIEAVFEACERAPWHKYLFLTKNPQRYNDLLGCGMLPTDDNYWYGGTRTGVDSDREHEASMSGHTFLSIEPIHGPLDDATAGALELWDWIIIGAETGNRKGKVIPKREWIAEIVDYCAMADVPLFMKGSLADIWGEPLIQQYPWEVRA